MVSKKSEARNATARAYLKDRGGAPKPYEPEKTNLRAYVRESEIKGKLQGK